MGELAVHVDFLSSGLGAPHHRQQNEVELPSHASGFLGTISIGIGIAAKKVKSLVLSCQIPFFGVDVLDGRHRIAAVGRDCVNGERGLGVLHRGAIETRGKYSMQIGDTTERSGYII